MAQPSHQADDAMTDARRRDIHDICQDYDLRVDGIEVRDNILILSSESEAALGASSGLDVEQARRLAGDLKQLGFDFVTLSTNDAAPSTEPAQP